MSNNEYVDLGWPTDEEVAKVRPAIYCACGCGTEVTYTWNSEPRQWARGHHMRLVNQLIEEHYGSVSEFIAKHLAMRQVKQGKKLPPGQLDTRINPHVQPAKVSEES